MSHLPFVENSFLKPLNVFCWYSIPIKVPVYIQEKNAF